jgi:hypothetical protein
VAGCCECGDEPSVSYITELVGWLVDANASGKQNVFVLRTYMAMLRNRGFI